MTCLCVRYVEICSDAFPVFNNPTSVVQWLVRVFVSLVPSLWNCYVMLRMQYLGEEVKTD